MLKSLLHHRLIGVVNILSLCYWKNNSKADTRIKSFPTIQSHYSQSSSSKGWKYLSPYLNVASMHKIYLKAHEPEEYEKLSGLMSFVQHGNGIRIQCRVAYRIFFMGGTHTLVRPLGGLVACSPRKIFCILHWTLTYFWGGGGGGGTQAGGGKSQCAPPLFATLQW